MSKKNIEPAYPQPVFVTETGARIPPVYSGMSLRDYFAGQICPSLFEIYNKSSNAYIARESYRLADEMMRVRNLENLDED